MRTFTQSNFMLIYVNGEAYAVTHPTEIIKMTTIFSLIRTYWVVISLLILTIITLLSLWPADQLPKVPGTDKTHHFIAYAGLMFPVALRQHKYWLVIGLVFIGWSGAIELIQPYVNRYGEWLDMLANTGGVVCGVVLAWVVRFLFLKHVD